MRIAYAIVAFTLLCACGSDRTPAAVSHDRSALETVRRIAGCYVLRPDSSSSYLVQLDTAREAGEWAAHLVGQRANPAPAGDTWSWGPAAETGDSGFVVHWTGIDGVMGFTVRGQGGWMADADMQTGQPITRSHTTTAVQRVTCPVQDA